MKSPDGALRDFKVPRHRQHASRWVHRRGESMSSKDQFAAAMEMEQILVSKVLFCVTFSKIFQCGVGAGCDDRVY